MNQIPLTTSSYIYHEGKTDPNQPCRARTPRTTPPTGAGGFPSAVGQVRNVLGIVAERKGILLQQAVTGSETGRVQGRRGEVGHHGEVVFGG